MTKVKKATLKRRNANLVPGDGVLVHGQKWISRAIIFFQKIYTKKNKLPNKKIYSHVAMAIRVPGTENQIGIIEATAKGINMKRYNSYYKSNRVKYIERVKELTKEEQLKISDTAYQSLEKVTRYDFLALPQNIRYIFTGKWRGKVGKKAEKRLFCSEAFATWHNELDPNIFKSPEHTNLVDINLNSNFKAKSHQVFDKQGFAKPHESDI